MNIVWQANDAEANQIGFGNLKTLAEVYAERYPDCQFEVELSVVEAADIQILNRKYRNLDEPTDVLSFPTFATSEELLQAAQEHPVLIGSIIICPGKAAAYGETLIQLTHHGLLHLLGYDHETDFASWQAEEERILELLYKNGLIIPPVQP